MKIYISADMEGITGVASWSEVERTHSDYEPHRLAMVAEVVHACQAAFACGATEVVVKDAHASGRNLRADELPAGVKLIRGWSGHPYSMVQGLDKSYDAIAFIGYHSRAGSCGNPLAHTMSSRRIFRLRVNGMPASEFLLHSHISSLEGVAVAFLAGDALLCAEAREQFPGLKTVTTMSGVGDSVVSQHPKAVHEAIRTEFSQALNALPLAQNPPITGYEKGYRFELTYKDPVWAYSTSFYPGVERDSEDEATIHFASDDYLAALTFLKFAL